MDEYLTAEWFDLLLHSRAELFAEAIRASAMVGPATRSVGIWRPAICNPYRCAIEQLEDGFNIRTIDDLAVIFEKFVPDPEAPLRVGEVKFRCPYHQSLTDPEIHFATLQEENAFRNSFEMTFVASAPEIVEDVPKSHQAMATVWRRTIATVNAGLPLDETVLLSGVDTQKVYRSDLKFSLQFDGDRKLVMDASALDKSLQDKLAAIATTDKYLTRVVLVGVAP